MDLLLTILLDDILPIFVVASVGFLLARRLHVDVKSLSRITFNALAPCLVFTLLVTSQVSAGEFGRIVAFTVLLVAAIGLVARVAAIPFRLDAASTRGVPDRRDVLERRQLRPVGRALRLRPGRPRAGRRLLRDERAADVHASGRFSPRAGTVAAGRRSAGWCGFRPSGGSWRPRWSSGRAPTLPKAVSRPVELLGAAAIPSMLLVLGMQFEKGVRPERPGLVAVGVGPGAGRLAAHRVPAGGGCSA